jgi:BASS family bile acid:Na+ symporter
MVSIGMQVTGAQIIGAVSNIGLMVRALLANLIILPLVAVLLVWAFSIPQGLAIGFLLVAASPGAPLIPKLAEVARANLPFAVGLMFILAVLAIVTTPLTASVILPLDENIQFDTLRVMRSLTILQLITLFAGLGIQRWLPKVKGVLLRPLILLANLSLIVIIALVVWRDYQTLFALPWTTVLAILLLISCALLSGWLLGGPQTGTRKALALGTSAQSNGLALLITSINFPGIGADIAVVAFGLLNIVINFGVAVYWGRERGGRDRDREESYPVGWFVLEWSCLFEFHRERV